MLALSLVRVAVFAGCGLSCWFAMQTFLPQFAEPLVCILTGGLLGVLFVRFWLIALTSSIGSVLMSYSGLIIAERIRQVIGSTRFLESQNIEARVSASIGIAAYPESADDVRGLIASADQAMYRAKAQGRNTYRFFTADMNLGAQERLTLENSLRVALDRRQLHLEYQPQVDPHVDEPGCVRWTETLAINYPHHLDARDLAEI